MSIPHQGKTKSVSWFVFKASAMTLMLNCVSTVGHHSLLYAVEPPANGLSLLRALQVLLEGLYEFWGPYYHQSDALLWALIHF